MPRFAICVAVLILTRTTLLCQVSTGTINVEVQDASGAVVPGAFIILTHVATGQTRQGTSNERGEFQAFFMPLGGYSLTVESPGFKKKTIAGLELRVDQSARIVAVLEPGEVRELVQVTEMTPLLETDTSSLGQVIENKKILD